MSKRRLEHLTHDPFLQEGLPGWHGQGGQHQVRSCVMEEVTQCRGWSVLWRRLEDQELHAQIPATICVLGTLT